MPSIDEILASSPLAGLCRVSASCGGRQVALVRLAESFTDLDRAPAASLVILTRLASAEVSDYRLDMALRWAAIHQVAAVAAFADKPWRPTVTARDIAARADIALISIPAGTEAAGLVQAIIREIGGGAERALGRGEQGLAAVLAAESAGGGVEELRAAVAQALGTRVEFRPWPDERSAVVAGDGAAARAAANGGRAPRPRRRAGRRRLVRGRVRRRLVRGRVRRWLATGCWPPAGPVPAMRSQAAPRMGRSARRSWSGKRRSGRSSRPMRMATSGSPFAWSCTPRP